MFHIVVFECYENQLVERLSATCPVYIVQGQSTYSDFVKMMNSWDANWPDRLKGVHYIHYPDAGGEHGYVATFIETLARRLGVLTNEVLDCQWGAMPPEVVRMDYAEAERGMMELLHSGDRWCFVSGSPGSGISSFIARWARTVAVRAQALVIRMECKEWLPLDVYVLFLLSCMGTSGKQAYNRVRAKSTRGWDRTSEAVAVAHAICSSADTVVLVVEHPERLEAEGITFLQSVLTNCPNLVLVFASRAAFPEARQFPMRGRKIRIGKPSRDSLERLVRYYAPSYEARVEDILSGLSERVPGSVCLAASLVQHGVLASETVALREKDEFLFALLEQGEAEGLPFEDVARACAVVRTPRPVALVRALCQEDLHVILRTLDKLSHLGILMKDERHTDVRYAMSTSIREMLVKRYFYTQQGALGEDKEWVRDDSEQTWRRLNLIAGHFFKDQLKKTGLMSPEEVAPHLCMILYHYEKAREWNVYLALVARWRKTMLYHWHFPLLERWLQAVPEEFLNQNPSDAVEFEYTLARIARVRCFVVDYRTHLQRAKEAFGRLKGTKRKAKQNAELKMETGILLSMDREYESALVVFREAREAIRRTEETETRMKVVARLAQASMSLGRYREARRYLETLDGMLKSTSLVHEQAVSARHWATLSALTAQAMERAGAPRLRVNKMLEDGRKWAQICYDLCASDAMPGDRPDESGMGIAKLKMAQVEWYARRYDAALVHITPAIGLLSGYPNSRWWRMSCHDIAARCHALLHRPAEARKHLDVAWDIFEDSGKTDIVRECELKRAEGPSSCTGKHRCYLRIVPPQTAWA